MMTRLSSTITQLAKFRAMAHGASADPVKDRLDDLIAFGSNPGALRARTYVPANLAKGAAQAGRTSPTNRALRCSSPNSSGRTIPTFASTGSRPSIPDAIPAKRSRSAR